MSEAVATPHQIVNPPDMSPAVGFAHAVIAAPGRVVYLGGQPGTDAEGHVVSDSLAEQCDAAYGNIAKALAACGGRPEHLVSMMIYVTDVAEYKANLRDIGAAYRKHLGKHFPAMALFGITELFDDGAKVEIVTTAVIPE